MKWCFLGVLICSFLPAAWGGSLNDSIFPLEHYDQRVSTWMDPNDPAYDQSLLESNFQEQRKEELYNHFFGSLSPWDENYVAKTVTGSTLQSEEEKFFSDYSAPEKYYGSNSLSSTPYPANWLTAVKENCDLAALDHFGYHSEQRGILVKNTAARILPTEQPAFLNPALPGEGDSFDYLQMSVAWSGTPVYVITSTKDRVWDLVLTPDFVAWVKSESVASVSKTFIKTWSAAAANQLIAITQRATPLNDEQGNFLSFAYIGSCFPAGKSAGSIMIPRIDIQGNAFTQEVSLPQGTSAPIPWSLTRHHMAILMNTLVGRPYRWGGMGDDFDNDCSAELKSLFLPFGIYLPRNSSEQVTAGFMMDKSSALPEERLSFLKEEGKPFLSLIYIGGHVMLYIGTYSNPDDPSSLIAMTYQNLWGLRPAAPFTESNPDKRFIIGKSAFFPLLLQYPEEPTAVSLAAKSYFKICDLSQFPLPLLQSSGPCSLEEKENRFKHLHLLMAPPRREL